MAILSAWTVLALYSSFLLVNRFGLMVTMLAKVVFPQQTAWTILGAAVVYVAIVYVVLTLAQQRWSRPLLAQPWLNLTAGSRVGVMTQPEFSPIEMTDRQSYPACQLMTPLTTSLTTSLTTPLNNHQLEPSRIETSETIG